MNNTDPHQTVLFVIWFSFIGIFFVVYYSGWLLKKRRQSSDVIKSEASLKIVFKESVKGTYKDFEYLLYQTKNKWWACYIKLPLTNKFYVYETPDLMPFTVPNGITFFKYINKLNEKDYPQGFSHGKWIGFDFGNASDLKFGVSNVDAPSIRPLYSYTDVETTLFHVIDEIKSLS